MIEAELTILSQVGIIIIAASLVALFAKFFNQPLLASYILAGIILGPVLGLISHENEVITMFTELGVAFLLFIVGLELDLTRLKEVRSVVLAAATAEILFMFALGFYIMYLLGFSSMEAVYVGLFVTFSSTAVVIKILSDSGDIDTLHGRMILGILLVQDIAVVIALSVLSTLHPPTFSPDAASTALFTGMGMLALAVVMSKYIMPYMFRQIHDSHELIFLLSIAILFGFVGLGQVPDPSLSTAIGGFLAGIALTAFPYNIEIAERARPMRDFFVTIFFVSLGTMVSLESIINMWQSLVILSLLVLFLKPFIINMMISLFKYGKKTSFYSGSSLAQTSEFAMVLALLGVSMGHIGRDMVSLAAALMIITIPATSYIMKYQRQLYEHVEEFILEFEGAQYEEERSEMEDHVVLCGSHITGRKILRFFEDQHERIVVVDYDPEIVDAVRDKGFMPIYGDIEDSHTLDRANVGKAKAVVSTVPREEDNRYLVNYVREENEDAVIIVTANDIESALLLYEEGADYVLYPKMLAAREAADLVEEFYQDGTPLEEAREEHIKELETEFEEHLLKQFEPDFVKVLKSRMDIGNGDDGKDGDT